VVRSQLTIGQGSGLPVSITVDGRSNVPANDPTFSYRAPSITSVAPLQARTDGTDLNEVCFTRFTHACVSELGNCSLASQCL